MSYEVKKNQRLSFKEKNANDKQWYKEQADMLDMNHTDNMYGDGATYSKLRINYDLYNNILNVQDLEDVCDIKKHNFTGTKQTITNRDIISGKVKALQGMEMKRPFSWKPIATNPEATTRKEEAEFNEVKKYVQSVIMGDLKKQIELDKNQALNVL